MPSHAHTAALRAFGEIEDLDIDFGSADRPAIVTALLARCAPGPDEAHWWATSVGERIAGLLRLLALTSGNQRLELCATCVAPGCGSRFEFALPLPALADRCGGCEVIEVALRAGHRLVLRRPTGEDLRAWRAGLAPAADEAARSMIDTLRLRGQAQPEDIQAIAAAMSMSDPLVDCAVDCHCPVCDGANEVTVDLEAIVLRRLEACQRELLREVHEFARHYGWTEPQTLALPRQRRAAYRALIDAAA